MNSILRLGKTSFMSALFVFTYLFGFGQVQPTLTLNQTIQIYLLQDCGTGEKDPAYWLKAVLAYGEEAVPPLLRFAEQGPSADDVRVLREAATSDFDSLQSFIKQGGLDALTEENVRQGAEQLNREDYVNMRLRSYVRGYQERALNALAATKSKNALRALQDILKQNALSDDLKNMVEETIGILRQ